MRGTRLTRIGVPTAVVALLSAGIAVAASPAPNQTVTAVPAAAVSQAPATTSELLRRDDLVNRTSRSEASSRPSLLTAAESNARAAAARAGAAARAKASAAAKAKA